MFLGGHTAQLRAKIPREIHAEFHATLRTELRAAGFSLNIGGRGGSTKDWVRLLRTDPGLQLKAFDAVLSASRAMDKKHGTTITQWVWHNLLGERFYLLRP